MNSLVTILRYGLCAVFIESLRNRRIYSFSDSVPSEKVSQGSRHPLLIYYFLIISQSRTGDL